MNVTNFSSSFWERDFTKKHKLYNQKPLSGLLMAFYLFKSKMVFNSIKTTFVGEMLKMYTVVPTTYPQN